MTAAVRHLPFGLARIVPPNLLGFAVINGFTFACDLGLLTALHGGLRWPVAVSITLSYAVASSLSYLLNRTFNFHSHAAIGRQVVTYIAVIAVNSWPGFSASAPGWPRSGSATSSPGSSRACAKRSTCTPPCAGWCSATPGGAPALKTAPVQKAGRSGQVLDDHVHGVAAGERLRGAAAGLASLRPRAGPGHLGLAGPDDEDCP